MDPKTLSAYAANAASYSADWLSQPAPSDMYALLEKYFLPLAATADIGCGNGRDTNWLASRKFPVTGFDSSEELLKKAKSLYPGITFLPALLPGLEEIEGSFANVLCETVLMHLPKAQIKQAVSSLKRILQPGGVMYLSWRVTEGEDIRHADGRLYSAFPPEFILEELEQDSILHFEHQLSASSGRRVCRVLYKKP